MNLSADLDSDLVSQVYRIRIYIIKVLKVLSKT